MNTAVYYYEWGKGALKVEVCLTEVGLNIAYYAPVWAAAFCMEEEHHLCLAYPYILKDNSMIFLDQKAYGNEEPREPKCVTTCFVTALSVTSFVCRLDLQYCRLLIYSVSWYPNLFKWPHAQRYINLERKKTRKIWMNNYKWK